MSKLDTVVGWRRDGVVHRLVNAMAGVVFIPLFALR
jgi:hypothetical protein